MADFKSFDADAEVIGEVVLGFIDAFPFQAKDVALKVLSWNGIHEVQSGEYYPLKSFLNAMQDISETFGSSMLFLIGEQYAINTNLPAEVKSLEECLASLDRAYRFAHKGGDIGYYEYSHLGVEGHLAKVRIVCHTPYPHAFEQGMIEGYVQRLGPVNGDTTFVLSDEPVAPGKSRDDRAYIISWLLSLESELGNLFAFDQSD
jgi:hypothetical protein